MKAFARYRASLADFRERARKLNVLFDGGTNRQRTYSCISSFGPRYELIASLILRLPVSQDDSAIRIQKIVRRG